MFSGMLLAMRDLVTWQGCIINMRKFCFDCLYLEFKLTLCLWQGFMLSQIFPQIFFFFLPLIGSQLHPFVLYNTSFFPTKNADKWDPSSPVLCSCSNNYMKYLEILMEYSIWIYQPCAITTQVFSLQNCCHNCIWLDKVNCCFYLQIN